MRRILAVFVATLVGCTTPTDVGPCDADRARRVVYDDTGAPAYEGQALVISSCGGGGFCHASSAEGVDRRNAPGGVDYDLRLVAGEDDLTRLEADQLRVVAHRGWIWDQVQAGLMPPGDQGLATLESAPAYSRYDALTDEATPLPGLDTDEGREILRNWLSCRAPVVERSTPREDGVTSVGAVVSGRDIEPIDPTWPALYARVIEPRCATAGCHDADEQAGGLELVGEADARTALVGSSATERGDCDGAALRVTAGDPDASLLMHKLIGRDATGAPVCGDPMPDSGGRAPDVWIDAFRAWIENGAPE